MPLVRHEGTRPMDVARRRFVKVLLAASLLRPGSRRAPRALLRVRYAEKPQRDECRGVFVPLTPEETARPAPWAG